MTTIRQHLEAQKKRHYRDEDHHGEFCDYCAYPPWPCEDHKAAVAMLYILDNAARIGEEDFEWSDTDRLVPDPEEAI